MVDVMGHLAMGLLWAVPAWFLWSGRTGLVFIAVAELGAPLPDVDLWIEKVAPALVHHHGITHTVVFVAALSVAIGGVAAATLTRPLDRWLRTERFTAEGLFVFVALAVLIGGLSHLFADMLSAPDVAQPIEPFWPLFDKPVAVDLLWYDAPVWNAGLLTAAVALHLAFARIVEPFDHPYRITDV